MSVSTIEPQSQEVIQSTIPAFDGVVVTNSDRPGVWRSIRNLLSQWQLIRIMVNRDLWGRFRGSVFGKAWPIITPFGYLCIYSFVFNVIMHVRFTSQGGLGNFALYFMTGMLPWTAFADAVARSTTVILETPNLVKRVVFPIEVLPVTVVLSGAMSQVLAVSVLVAASWIFVQLPSWKLVFLPFVLLSQLIFTVGLCWFFAAIGVYFRDMKHFMALALSAWMFATPIAYPATAFPAKLKFMLWINPMAGIVTDYRRILLENHMPYWPMYCFYTAISLAVFILGFTFFYKTERSFADVI
jgi:lipopolysaccharide transport system permease protein